MATRLLIIHPELVFAVSIKQALEQNGRFVVHLFTKAETALDFLKTQPQDIVLLAVNLADSAVESSIHDLRSIQADIAIIVTPHMAESAATRLNIQGMIDSPFSARDLLPLLQSLVKSRSETKAGNRTRVEARQTNAPPPTDVPEFESLSSVIRDFPLEGTTPLDAGPVDTKEVRRKKRREEFDNMVESMRRDEPRRSLLDRTTDFGRFDDSNFDRLAEEEPPMPSMDEGGTVSDLLSGIIDTNFRDVLRLLNDHEPSRQMQSVSDNALNMALSQDEPPIDEEASVAQIILQAALQSYEEGNQSVEKLMADIEDRLQAQNLRVRPLPSWNMDTANFLAMPDAVTGQKSRAYNDPGFLPDEFSTGEILPPPDLPELAEPEVWTTRPGQAVKSSIQAPTTYEDTRLEPGYAEETIESRSLPVAPPNAPEAIPDDAALPTMMHQPDTTLPWDLSGAAEVTQVSSLPFDDESAFQATVAGKGLHDEMDALDTNRVQPILLPNDPAEWATGEGTAELADDLSDTPVPMVANDELGETPRPFAPVVEGEPEERFDFDAAASFDEVATAAPVIDDPWSLGTGAVEPEAVAADDAWSLPVEEAVPSVEVEADAWSLPQEAAPPADELLTPEGAALAQLALNLTQLSLETSAEGTFLTRDEQIVAAAGHLSRTDVLELREHLSRNWRGGRENALLQPARLPSSGKEYLMYSIITEDNLVLSMIFAGTTPLGVIRQQTIKLAAALKSVDQIVPAAALSAVVEPSMPSPAINREAFSYVWLVRDPEVRLSKAVIQSMNVGLLTQLEELQWKIRALQVAEDFIYLYADVPAEVTTSKAIQNLKERSATIAAKQDPTLTLDDLWADSYLVVSPGREISPQEIRGFIEFQRIM
jgi:DNA-binding NarL/FixJ family response regulator/REP element-mobilizing transposase RayT